MDYLTTHTSQSPIWRGFAPGFVNYKKWHTRLAAASDKVYQLLVHGRWFPPGTPASSTTKTGRHDIVEILLKVALSTIYRSINQSIKGQTLEMTKGQAIFYIVLNIKHSNYLFFLIKRKVYVIINVERYCTYVTFSSWK